MSIKTSNNYNNSYYRDYFFPIVHLTLPSAILSKVHGKYLEQLKTFLLPVLQIAPAIKFVRCWRAKTDGWAASIFHSNCDGKGSTATIIKVSSYIFGGYTDVSWSSKYHFISGAGFFQCVSLLMVNTCFAISVYYILIPHCSNRVQLAFTSNHQ